MILAFLKGQYLYFMNVYDQPVRRRKGGQVYVTVTEVLTSTATLYKG